MTSESKSPWSRPMADPGGRLPNNPRCPSCGRVIDGFTDPTFTGKVPSPGSVSVCVYCAEISVFTEALELQRPDETERVLLAAHPEIKRLVGAIKRRRAGTAGAR